MVAKLTEEQFAALETQHKKIAEVEWNGHTLVFRRPTREECRQYRVALEDPVSKADANEHLLQQTIVAFDDETNPTAARMRYNPGFLDEHPMFSIAAKVKLALAALMGIVETEDAADLGKGVTVRPRTPSGTPQA
jgi:hypothetical protein